MNILFLTQVLPFPLDAGPKVRAYYVLRHLAKSHQVTLLSFVRQTDPPESIQHLQNFCKRVITVNIERSPIRDGLAFLTSLVQSKPFLITRDQSPEMHTAIAKVMVEDKFHAVHADQLWMASYALYAKTVAMQHGYPTRLILDQHNAAYLIPQRMAADADNIFLRLVLLREAAAMSRYESNIINRFDEIIWVTEEDYKAVRKLNPASDNKYSLNSAQSENNHIIPICIDPDEIFRIQRSSLGNNLLFVGGMHWPPNADGVSWFVSDIFPLIKNRLSDARFIAVGKSPPKALLNNRTNYSNDIVTPGFVENIDGLWSEAKAFVVPLRAAGGMRVKILDAWGRGIPVISTTIGAEGIAYQDGVDIMIGDTPQEFAGAVTRVLSDDKLRNSIAQMARKTVEEIYNWRTSYARFNEIYPQN